MKQTIFVKFSYENRVSEEIAIDVELDLTKNSNRKKLLNRLLKSDLNIATVCENETDAAWWASLKKGHICYDV
jgi:hypothetical protein